MIRSIFSAIDSQEHSGRAADAAIEMARATSAKLTFFMANPAMPGHGPAIHVWTRDYIEEYFSQARAWAGRSGVYDTKCITKNVADIGASILLEAGRAGADYIVMGSDSRPGPFRNWKYSITREVAAKAHCPTIIVHSALPQRSMVSRLLAAE